MKCLMVLITMLVSSTIFAAPSDQLIAALIKVESNGNDHASGDNGNAIGCLQLWESYVQSACTDKVKFKSSDRYSRTKSIEIFKSFMAKYATSKRLSSIKNELAMLEQRSISEISDEEVICRIHNGGIGFCFRTKKERDHNDFSGRNRRLVNTAFHWSKVKAVMEIN